MILKFELFQKRYCELDNNKLFLFYGNNFGKAQYCATKIISYFKKKFMYKPIFFTSSDFSKRSFKEIILNYDSDDLFGNKFLIIINVENKFSNKELIEIVKKNTLKNLKIIIKAERLDKGSVLRKSFETINEAIIVPCYEETFQEKIEFIKEEFDNDSLSIESSNVHALANFFGNQRLEIDNELQKIKVLLKLQGDLGSNFVKEIPNTINFDESLFVFNIVSGKDKNFLAQYQKYTEYEKNEMRMINALIEHFFKILTVKNKISQGKTMYQSVKELRPPVFFKLEKEFQEQIRYWDQNNVISVIKELFNIQKKFLAGSTSSNSDFLFLIIKIMRKNF